MPSAPRSALPPFQKSQGSWWKGAGYSPYIYSAQRPAALDRYLALDGAVSAEFQESLSPEDAVTLLKDGARRSALGMKASRKRGALLADAAGGQHPYATVVACIDSRAPPETIFDASIGDLFVARVAGNVASPDVIGSVEYACK